MIDILIPVLDRPQNAAPVAASARDNTQVPCTVIFICTRGDHGQIEACKNTRAVTVLVDEQGYAPKINHGCEYATGDFVFLGADDLKFHPGWDEAALAAYEASGKLVIGTNDLGNPTVMAGRHATHSLVHRDYIALGTIDEPGKLLHEGYAHNYVDNEFVGTARARDQWTFAADSRVEHLHPFWRKGRDDRVYEIGRRTYHADARLCRKRQRLWL